MNASEAAHVSANWDRAEKGRREVDRFLKQIRIVADRGETEIREWDLMSETVGELKRLGYKIRDGGRDDLGSSRLYIVQWGEGAKDGIWGGFFDHRII